MSVENLCPNSAKQNGCYGFKGLPCPRLIDGACSLLLNPAPKKTGMTTTSEEGYDSIGNMLKARQFTDEQNRRIGH